jgi:hypothetical protein
MLGPIEGANMADRPNKEKPIACFAGGSICSTAVKPSGMSAPPKKPCPARKTIMLPRLQAWPQRAEKTKNNADVKMRYRRNPKIEAIHAVSGMTMISGTRYAIEIQELSSKVAPIAPEMSRSEELVIWISSTAMKAPSMPPSVPIQARVDPGVTTDVALDDDVFIGVNLFLRTANGHE